MHPFKCVKEMGSGLMVVDCDNYLDPEVLPYGHEVSSGISDALERPCSAVWVTLGEDLYIGFPCGADCTT